MTVFALACNLGALALLTVAALVMSRRDAGGFSLAAAVPVGLAVYLPLRALVIGLGLIDENRGVNLRVALVLAGVEDRLAATILAASAAFLVGVLCTRPRAQAASTARVEPDPDLARWRSAGGVMYVLGFPGIVAQFGTSLSIVSADAGGEGGGFVGQFALLLYFTVCAALLLTFATTSRLGPLQLMMVLPPAVGALASASKDSIVILGVSVACGLQLRARLAGGAVEWRFVRRLLAAAVVLVFVAFPAIQAYRIGIEAKGDGLVAALFGIPDVLAHYDIATGRPFNSDDVSFVTAISQPLVYLSNRFHGADSLALLTGVERDPSYLPATGLVALPLAVVLPLDTIGLSDTTGRRFALEYWGSSFDGTTHVAISAFGQVGLAYGLGGLIVVALLWGGASGWCARAFSSSRIVRHLFAFAVLLSLLGFERDIATSVVTALRRIVVVGLVYLVFIRRRRPRTTAPPQRGSMPGARPDSPALGEVPPVWRRFDLQGGR